MIHRDDHDGIVVLRIDHGKANAFDPEMGKTIVEAFDDVDPPPCAPALGVFWRA